MRRAKSSREIRRQKARNDRKALAEMQVASADALKARLYRNGITLDDLQKEYYRGAADGRKFAEDFAFHTIYAAFLITMIKGHGMGQEEAVDLLTEIDRQTVLCADDQELTEQAYRETGIELNWRDPIERITRRED